MKATKPIIIRPIDLRVDPEVSDSILFTILVDYRIQLRNEQAFNRVYEKKNTHQQPINVIGTEATPYSNK